MQSNLVWEGKIGQVPLRVEVPHAGKILADWESAQGRRQKICGSIEEFERAVLFQIVVASGQTDASGVKKVLEAVTIAEAERPAPARQEGPKRPGKPKVRRHRRSRTPPRRR